MIIPARPERIFPLLCPVREFDWIPNWTCEVIHSVSGVAEDGCVFRTKSSRDGGKMTWVVSVYEPPLRIEFSSVAPDVFVMRLKIRLAPDGQERTLVRWRREYLSLSESGDLHLATHMTESARMEMMVSLERCLREYLKRTA
jgi:hypothetical protein